MAGGDLVAGDDLMAGGDLGRCGDHKRCLAIAPIAMRGGWMSGESVGASPCDPQGETWGLWKR
jgi:hypothetical protein